MSTTTTTLHSVSVSTKDGSYFIAPQPQLGAALLDGMIEAQRRMGQLAWDEFTTEFVKGHVIATGERVVVWWSNLPMTEEDKLADWLFEHVEVQFRVAHNV